MAEWELTDQEIMATRSEYFDSRIYNWGEHLAIAKAAQKKLFHWMDIRWRSYEETEDHSTQRMTFAISEDQWKNLRQLLGD